MQLKLAKNAVTNPLLVLRRAGYSAFVDPVTKKESFVLRLTSSFYPRFHTYVKHENDNVIFDVHLDQKQPSYGQGHMHAGEYDGPSIEREVKRIASWANAVSREEHTRLPKAAKEERKDPMPKNPRKWSSWFWS